MNVTGAVIVQVVLIALSMVCCDASSNAAAYASASSANSRSVHFAVVSPSAVLGTPERLRYTAFTDRTVSRVQQAIEFSAPASSTNATFMNVTVYVNYYAPTMVNSSNLNTVSVYILSSGDVMSYSITDITNQNSPSSVLGESSAPSLKRTKLLSCYLPSVATNPTLCPSTPFLCGVAQVPYPTQSAASTSPLGTSQALLASVGTEVLYIKTASQDSGGCRGRSMEVTAIWDDPQVSFRSSLAYNASQSIILPDALLPIASARSQATAATFINTQFTAGSNPIGSVWMPPLVDDTLRAYIPLGSYYTRFTLSNYSASSINFVSPTGFTCAVDDSLIPSGTGWSSVCVIPLKGFTSGSLSAKLSDSLNCTGWWRGVDIKLESTVNTSIPPRSISCSPSISVVSTVATRSCRMFTDCTQSPIFFGVGDGSGQRYSQMTITWSPTSTGYVPPMIADNDESESSACTSSTTLSLTFASAGDAASANCYLPYQFECKVDHSCISNQQVCDGVVDCTDGADEALCSGWTFVRTSGTFPLCPDQLVSTDATLVNTYLTCLKFAQSNPATVGGLRYTVDTDWNGKCELFSPYCVSGLNATSIAQATTSTPSLKTALLVLRLPTSVKSNLLAGAITCTSMLSCNGRGVAMNMTVASVGSGCVCTCNPGFAGVHCDTALPLVGNELVMMQMSGRMDPTASWLQSISDAVPAAGWLWVELAYYVPSTNITAVLVGSASPGALVEGSTGMASLIGAYKGAAFPIYVAGEAVRCDFDDVSRIANCRYFRANSTSPFVAVVTAIAPLQVTTLDVTAYRLDGSVALTKTCTATERILSTDLSRSFLQDDQNGIITESWCPKLSSCVLSRSPLSGDVTTFVINFQLPVGYNSTTLAVGCRGASASFDGRTILPQLALIGQETMASLQQSAEAYLVIEEPKSSALAFFAASAVLTVLSGFLFVVFRRRDEQLVEVAKGVAESRIAMRRAGLNPGEALTLTTLWSIRVSERSRRGADIPWYWHPRRHVAMWITFAFICLGITVVSVIYYFLVVPNKTSNYTAILQIFEDSSCNASQVSPYPSGALILEASGDCDKVSVTGKLLTFAPNHMSATCTANTVIIQYGGSGASKTCPASSAIALPVGVCTPVLFQDPKMQIAPAVIYVVAVCGDDVGLREVVADLDHRFPLDPLSASQTINVPFTQAAAEGLTSSSAGSDNTVTGQQVPTFLNSNPFSSADPTTGAALSVYYYYDTTQSEMQFSSTQTGLMLSVAQGDSSAVIGPNSVGKELLVSQTTADLLSTTVVEDIDAYELSIPDSSRFLPRTVLSDLPVGRFFNGYGRTVNGTLAGSSDGSIRERLIFPGVEGQNADIGNGDATIAFWMRAGPTSRGFPVALVDNWRLMSTGEAPLLDRLERMILTNSLTSDNWFSDDWNVYYAIYVDGVEQRIHFVSAGPLAWQYTGFQSSSVFSVTWDVAALGLQRIFTNRWHYVAITLEYPVNEDESGSQSSGLVIRLTVDGETYSGSQGFLQCLMRQVEPVHALWDVPLRVPQDSVVMQGGAVVIGSINAGLYGIYIYPTGLQQSDLIAMGTIPMNNYFTVNSAQFFALGFYVTFIGVSMLCMMLVGVVIETMSERRKRLMAEMAAGDAAFSAVTGVAINSEKLKVSGKDFRHIHPDTARAISGLDRSIFTTMLNELRATAHSPDSARADLMAILWARGQELYIPTTSQLAAIRQNFVNAEKCDISKDGHFMVPVALWNDFADAMVAYWEPRLEHREFTDEQLKMRTGNGKLQVKIVKVKVKVSKGAGGKSGGRGGRSGSSLRKLTNNIKLNAVAPIQMIMPAILAMQSAATYIKNFSLPVQYQDVFSNVIAWFKLTWASIPALPDLFFAVFQFVIAIGVTLLLIYFCVSDHDEWLSFVSAYAAKRDVLDAARIKLASQPPKTKSQRKALLVSLYDDDALQDDALFSEGYRGNMESFERVRNSDSESESSDDNGEAVDVITPRTMPLANRNWYESMIRYILPLRLSIPIDEFIDKSRRSNLVRVRKDDLVPAQINRKHLTWEIAETQNSNRNDGHQYICYDAHHRDAKPVPLINVGIVCPLHRGILCELDQRDTCIRPYRCFVVHNCQRCKTKEGTMFVCKHRMPDGKFCPYSLCQTHMRTDAIEFIKVSIKSSLMEMFGEGISAFIAFVAISLTSVIYFPVVQTCLQFLVCDPQYQCLIPHCWSDADALFILAASIVILILAVVGVGMPVVMYWELRRRHRVLFALFHRKEYHKVYLAVDEEAMEEVEEREQQAAKSVFSTDKKDPTEEAGLFGFLAKFFCKTITGETVDSEIIENLSVIHKDTVDFGEWERFLAGDNSAMQLLYRFLEYEYITLPPFLMLYRVAVLVPTVFVTDDLFTQMMALAIVEIGFGVFIFWTEPYINPWIDTMYRAGSVHNILLIGLGAINQMLTVENSTIDLTNVMLLVTGIYFMFVVGLIIMTTVWPTLSIALTQIRVETQMRRIGMRTMDMSSVFLNPFIHKQRYCSIPEVLNTYEDFVRRHPEANISDDVNDAIDDDAEKSRRDALESMDMNKKIASGEINGTVGQGLLGPLAGVPAKLKAPTPAPESGRLSARALLDNVLAAVGVTDDPDDCEDDLQHGEMDR